MNENIDGVIMNNGKLLVAILLVFGILLAGCINLGGPQETAKTTDKTGKTGGSESVQTAKRPVFTIMSPDGGETITTDGETADVKVTLGTIGLIIKNPGGKAKAGEGHFHIWIDDGKSTVVASKTYTLQNIQLGEHTLNVELVNNDHTSYIPKIMKTAAFTVEKAKPKEGEVFKVKVNEFSYEPKDITIAVGDTIVWENIGKMPHTATKTGKDGFDTGSIKSGESKAVKMTTVGSYEYSCTFHPNMKGRIAVK